MNYLLNSRDFVHIRQVCSFKVQGYGNFHLLSNVYLINKGRRKKGSSWIDTMLTCSLPKSLNPDEMLQRSTLFTKIHKKKTISMEGSKIS